ncbi:MAG TPA: DUF1611 domain-containing protein [Puia sp.]|nr:DUF1611 domain-containing protein [Puia sp.]
MQTAIVLTNGLLSTNNAKTAHGLIRGSERYRIGGIIDAPATAGGDAGVLLDGKHRGIPVFADLDAALHQLPDARFLIIGVATVGGYLPPDMLVIVKEAILRGLSIVNGLHEYLSEKPAIAALAKQEAVELIDIRKPKPPQELHFWTGRIFEIPVSVIAVLGMDCATGKRTTARLLKEACVAVGLPAEMIYTGQTGWLQGLQYGFILDSTLNDFVSGELEHAILQCWKETGAKLIFLEGQSALRNPSGPCGLELLISGHAKYTVLVYAPKRIYYDEDPKWGAIPPVETEIELIEMLGSKVIALALNTHDCTKEEATGFQAELEKRLGIPVLLPLEEGVDRILPTLNSLVP